MWTGTWICRLSVLVSCLLVCGAAASASPGGAVALTTDYVYRGISRSGHRPAVQVDLHLKTARGGFGGVWGSVVDDPPALVAPNELNLYLGWLWSLGQDWSAGVHYARYLYPSDPRYIEYDHDEVQAALSFQDRAVVSVALAPRIDRYSLYGDPGQGRQWSFEASLTQPLWRNISLTAGVGHYDLSDVIGATYWGWSGGLRIDVKRIQFTLSHFGADSAARQMFGTQVAHGRWALTAAWWFQ